MIEPKKFDYEQMYHILNRHRGQELILLNQAGTMLCDLYAWIIQRDTLFSPDTPSWERKKLGDAMNVLTNTIDAMKAVDAEVEKFLLEQVNIAKLEIVDGKQKDNSNCRSGRLLDGDTGRISSEDYTQL